jgi:endonuclease III
MKAQIALKIFKTVWNQLCSGGRPEDVFGHRGKCQAIMNVFINLDKYWNEYQSVENKIDYLENLPWIGKITKYHLAKNLGYDCVKPDRHLVRIAKSYNLNPLDMCLQISKITGDRLGLVDLVIWRAANLGLI